VVIQGGPRKLKIGHFESKPRPLTIHFKLKKISTVLKSISPHAKPVPAHYIVKYLATVARFLRHLYTKKVFPKNLDNVDIFVPGV